MYWIIETNFYKIVESLRLEGLHMDAVNTHNIISGKD